MQMKVTEKKFPVVLFIILYIVNLTFESQTVDEIIKCDHQNNKRNRAVLSCDCLLC